jgi:hypothetical protein
MIIENITNDLFIPNYNSKDKSLLNIINIKNSFNIENNYIILNIYDEYNNKIYSNNNFNNYKPINKINDELFDSIELNPEEDLIQNGFSNDNFYLNYIFYKDIFDKNDFFITNISPDRKEIELKPLILDNGTLKNLYLKYILEKNENLYYSDFYLYINNEQKAIGVNININEDRLYIKLYEELPSDIEIKEKIKLIELISEPKNYFIQNNNIIENVIPNNIVLKKPNFLLNLNYKENTNYFNFNDLSDIDINLIKNNIRINIDYSDLKNFIHFSSAYERLDNFLLKLSNIQILNNNIELFNQINQPNNHFQNQINNIIEEFDEYEYFLYYNDLGFPKISGSNIDINSIDALIWIGSKDITNQYYGGKKLEYFNFDISNRDFLFNNLPDYIKFDEENILIKKYISLIGQHFDNIWIYIKDITNKYDNDNRVDFGISNDLIQFILKEFNLELYNSLKTPIYLKRLYNNLPYLLKNKGTKNNLQAILRIFNISSSFINLEKDKYFKAIKADLAGINIPFLPTNYYLNKNLSDNTYPDYFEFKIKLTQNNNINIVNSNDGILSINLNHLNNNKYNLNGNIGLLTFEKDIILNIDKWITVRLIRENIGKSFTDISPNNSYKLYINNSDLTEVINIDGTNHNIDDWGSFNYLIFNDDYYLNEFRYWVENEDDLSFNEFCLNRSSFFKKDKYTSYNELIYRIPFGNELYTDLNSVHINNIEPFITGSNILIINDIVYYDFIDYYVEDINIKEEDILLDNTLSPFISIKDIKYENKNIDNLNIGFNLNKYINQDIINQSGYLDYDELLGDIDYNELNNYKKFYYKKFKEKNQYNKLLKLLNNYNNDVYNYINDFKPLNSLYSEGILLSNNILERNKKIDVDLLTELKDLYTNIPKIGNILGSNNLDSKLKFNYNNNYSFINGLQNVLITDNRCFFNGEFESKKTELYKIPSSSIVFINSSTTSSNFQIPLNPIENYYIDYKVNKKLLNIDYFNNINIPTNINFITRSLFNNLDIPYIYSVIQDYNYNSTNFLNSRYNGVKLISDKINQYNINDISFGKTSNINYESLKFGYFEEIISNGDTLPGRLNVNVKFLIDENNNLLELSEQNTNLDEIQKIYNRESCNILLDNNTIPTEHKNLNGNNTIFSGGFIYKPVLQNLTTAISTENNIEFLYDKNKKILNTDNISNSIDLNNNSIILGNPFLNGTINSSINTLQNSLFYSTNSKIIFPITRNTTFPGEIRQNITGSIKIKMIIGANNNLQTQLFSNLNYTGTKWIINGELNTTWLYSEPEIIYVSGEQLPPNDRIRSIIIPDGLRVKLDGSGGAGAGQGPLLTLNGPISASGDPHPLPGTAYGCPLCFGESGVSGIEITNIDTTANISYNSVQNPFSLNNNMITNIINNNEYIISGSDGFTAEYEFPFNGLLILPEGVNTANIELLKENETEGRIKLTSIITKTSNSRIRFINNILESNNTPLTNPYYFPNPPEYLYITSSIDYGFLSGSTPTENFYFYRTSSLENPNSYNILMASDYLYDIYQELENKTQISPMLSLIDGYNYLEVNDYLHIKNGDLLKLYDTDQNLFPSEYEFEINNIYIDNDKLYIKLTEDIPSKVCIDYIENNSNAYKIQNFIFLSKIKDETNIIINNTKKEGKTSKGIIIPNNINNNIKNKIGNIIKDLKNQNIL